MWEFIIGCSHSAPESLANLVTYRSQVKFQAPYYNKLKYSCLIIPNQSRAKEAQKWLEGT